MALGALEGRHDRGTDHHLLGTELELLLPLVAQQVHGLQCIEELHQSPSLEWLRDARRQRIIGPKGCFARSMTVST